MTMEATIKALLLAMFYMEEWDENTLDAKISVDTLSAIAKTLQDAGPEEIKIIAKVADELATSTSDESSKGFYEGFIEQYFDKYDENWSV
jgi:hypothetical protein